MVPAPVLDDAVRMVALAIFISVLGVGAQAEKAEQEVLGQTAAPTDSAGQNAPPAAAPAGPPKEIALGQTFDQVTAILGQPKSVMDLGAKKIYVYPDMKITFNAGKVTDVQ